MTVVAGVSPAKSRRTQPTRLPPQKFADDMAGAAEIFQKRCEDASHSESTSCLGGPAVRNLLQTYPQLPHGRGCGVGRGLGAALGVAVPLGVGVAVAVAVAVGVGVTVGVGGGVEVGVAVGVGGGGDGVAVGVASDWAGA